MAAQQVGDLSETNISPDNGLALGPRKFNVQALVPSNIRYKFRGYYALGDTYETWTSIGDPSKAPPSGHALTDIVIVTKWSISASVV